MVHKLTSTTYLMMPFLQKRSFDQKFSLCDLTENNYSSPGFNYLYYQIITLSKICRNFFWNIRSDFWTTHIRELYKKKFPKSIFLVISHHIGHLKNFPIKLRETIGGIIYWKRNFQKMILVGEKKSFKVFNFFTFGLTLFYDFQFFDAVSLELNTRNFNFSENV